MSKFLTRLFFAFFTTTAVLAEIDCPLQAQSLPYSDLLREELSEELSENITDLETISPLTQEIPPNETPDEIPEETPDDKPTDEMPEEIPEEIPDDKPTDEIPEETPDEMPTEETKPEKKKSDRPTQHIGIGANIGVDGNDLGLSDTGFAIITRTDLNPFLSIRGTNVFGGDRNDSTLALTFNLPILSDDGELAFMPFIGGGIVMSSESFLEDLIIRGLVTGGIDIPLSDRITATAGVNIGFDDDTNIGVRLGVMYGF